MQFDVCFYFRILKSENREGSFVFVQALTAGVDDLLQGRCFLFADTLDILQCQVAFPVQQLTKAEDQFLPLIRLNAEGNIACDILAKIQQPFSIGRLSRRKTKETNIDYLKRLSDGQKIDFSIFDSLPKKFSQQELVLLMLLCIKDKLYFSDISALNIRFRNVDDFIERMHGIIERVPVSKGEKARHSSEKLVHNSKYYLLSLMRDLDSEEIINTIKYIVSKLSKDRAKRRLYIETVLFDTLNQLFGHSKGAGKLILDIYEELEPDLNQDMDYWLQRSKSIYRIYPKNYSKLKTAYQYAKKSASDGDSRIQAKAALTTSLICCLLARQCRNEMDQRDYEIEAITSAETAVTSVYFKMNRKNLKGELGLNKREPYFDMILQVCDKHSDPAKDLHIAWKAASLRKEIINVSTDS